MKSQISLQSSEKGFVSIYKNRNNAIVKYYDAHPVLTPSLGMMTTLAETVK